MRRVPMHRRGERGRLWTKLLAGLRFHTGGFCVVQIISGNFKLILGLQTYGLWYGPRYPNATTNHSTDGEFDCGSGCLFDIVSS